MSSLNLQTCFTFVSADGSSNDFVPAQHFCRIASISELLKHRLAPGSVVSLLYRSEPNLILTWLACIKADLKPLILQYPTRKQARNYWADSISNSLTIVGAAAVIADDHCSEILASYTAITVISQSDLDNVEERVPPEPMPQAFNIIQLSSGTTGNRKAIEFTSDMLARHVEDYNAALGLTSSDKIVSWLPLYHDMGYIACFVMPLMLGINVVIIDPMTWVQTPELLFDTIEAHNATHCYMPNFGFEVMARCRPRTLPSMRRWISCSEPVSVVTSLKFLAAINAPTTSFSACYAMAENVFAVTLGEGCETVEIDGVQVLSCGRPIPGVEVKIVDGEIWVKSPSSIVSYLFGEDIRDEDGFYATGDLGQLRDGALFVSGRKQDLLVQAGRKYILSDIDMITNQLYPDVRGRAAALALFDPRIGTEAPTVLIETPNFFVRSDGEDIAANLKSVTGLDQLSVAFVPPRFLTKTSSGKVNRRKSAADWAAVTSAKEAARPANRDPRSELKRSFGSVDWGRPVGEVLDSLSRTILRIILDPTGVQLSGDVSLQEIDAKLAAYTSDGGTNQNKTPTGIRIVSLADRLTLRNITEQHLDALEEAFGCPVSLEHVCLPPSVITLSDLIFHDYFRPRLSDHGFGAVDQAMEQLKGASIILTDDVAELFFLYESAYPALSHNLERDERADLISFRWQQYTRNHDQLPLTVIGGIDIPLASSNEATQQMSRYLSVPVFRIARLPTFKNYTADWEYQALAQGDHMKGVDPDDFVQSLVTWAGSLSKPVVQKNLRTGSRLSMADLGHFCSHMASRAAVDQVLGAFDSFCIAGEPASLPYVSRKLTEMRKSYVRVPSHSAATIAALDESFDCLLLCGSVGPLTSTFPVVALQHADNPWRSQNLGALAETLAALNEMPVSGTDWFHTFELLRGQDYPIWSKARVELAETRAKNMASRRNEELETTKAAELREHST